MVGLSSSLAAAIALPLRGLLLVKRQYEAGAMKEPQKRMTAKKTLNVPPFPPLTWGEYAWEGKITLPSWAGFQNRGGPYGARNRKKLSDGRRV
jgi:hypothetical protein